MADFKVTPWEVEGKIDYEKLVKEFGTKRMDARLKAKLEKLAGGSHVFLRRNFFFSHRDLDLVLKDYESGKGFFLYTGRSPAGAMTLAHLISFLFTKWLQEKFKVNAYLQIPDEEKFLFKQKLSWEEVQERTKEDIAHIAALGFDENRTFLFQNSEYVKNFYPVLMKTAKKINFSNAKAIFGFNEQSNIGMMFYPALQIVPTFFEKKRCLIPCGIDQDNYWRPQRDIAESLGFYKTAAIHSAFFPPLTGHEGKMSSSIAESAIFLSDDEKTVANKINKYAFSGGQATIEEHRKLGGNPDVDVAFQWLYTLFEEDDKKIEKIREQYRSGKMLTGELKQILIEKINAFLKEHNKRKEKAEKAVDRMKYSGKLAKEMWGRTI